MARYEVRSEAGVVLRNAKGPNEAARKARDLFMATGKRHWAMSIRETSVWDSAKAYQGMTPEEVAKATPPRGGCG
jgi:hypothetical protein